MASLPPLGGPPPALSGQKARGKSETSPRSRSEDPATAAMQAQRDASRQIEAASQSVDEARHEADTRIDGIRDYYDGRSEQEFAREEGAFEQQRLKGYERLKELKRTQEQEMSRVRRESERDLDKLTNYYRDTSYQTERSGDTKLQELQKEQGRTYEHAVESKNQDVDMERQQFNAEVQELRTRDEGNINALLANSRERYDRLRDNTTEANVKAEQSFSDKYQARLKESDQTIVDLEARASAGIREIRMDTSQKLAAYSDRQSDPFYRMLDMNARIEEDGDSYTLRATIPVHEQKHVAVSVKGGQLVLTGARRSEEKIELEPGHTQGTSGYQSFLETFPIAWPVNANKLTRSFDGDQLTARVPKKKEGSAGYVSQAEAKIPVPRARLERPKFPENLPHVSQNAYDENPDGPDANRKSKGSGTLS